MPIGADRNVGVVRIVYRVIVCHWNQEVIKCHVIGSITICDVHLSFTNSVTEKLFRTGIE